jgi:hypothetical protein
VGRQGHLAASRPVLHEAQFSGATVTPRKTNYDFERREREKNKAAESAKKAQAKADRKASEQGTPDSAETTDPEAPGSGR